MTNTQYQKFKKAAILLNQEEDLQICGLIDQLVTIVLLMDFDMKNQFMKEFYGVSDD